MGGVLDMDKVGRGRVRNTSLLRSLRTKDVHKLPFQKNERGKGEAKREGKIFCI